MSKPPQQSDGERVQALVEALDGLDTTDRAAVREIAAIVRWAREKIEQERVRRADVSKNLLVVLFSVIATVVGGLLLAKLK